MPDRTFPNQVSNFQKMFHGVHGEIRARTLRADQAGKFTILAAIKSLGVLSLDLSTSLLTIEYSNFIVAICSLAGA